MSLPELEADDYMVEGPRARVEWGCCCPDCSAYAVECGSSSAEPTTVSQDQTPEIQIPKGGWTVELEYFRPSGKWYSDGTYRSLRKQLWKIWEDVERMAAQRCLPGLQIGHGNYTVRIVVPDHPHACPHLVLATENRVEWFVYTGSRELEPEFPDAPVFENVSDSLNWGMEEQLLESLDASQQGPQADEETTPEEVQS